MSKTGIFNISNEGIEFQTDGFGKDIEDVLTRIRENYTKAAQLYDCKEKKELDSLIYKRTGIMVGIEFNTSYIGAVDVPMITKNHIFIDNHFRDSFHNSTSIGLIEKIKKQKLVNRVDLKKAKLSGIFADLPSILLVSGEEFLKKTLTVAEYTAIILHELGHVFGSYEFINRTSTTNQILAAVCRTVQEKDDFKTKEIVFKEASDLLNAKGDTVTSLVNQRDMVVVSTVIIKSSLENAASEIGLSEYDISAFEQLADNFSARFGYGRDLITALDKLHKDRFFSVETGRMSYFIAFLFQSLYILVSLIRISLIFACVASGAYLFALIHLILTLLFYSAFANSGAKNKDYTYDTLKVRHTRIKEQLIERLKDKNTSDKERASILESIKVSEKIIEETFVYAGPMEIISNFVFSNDRETKSAIELQRNLEVLASNDFFVKSAQLNSLSV